MNRLCAPSFVGQPDQAAGRVVVIVQLATTAVLFGQQQPPIPAQLALLPPGPAAGSAGPGRHSGNAAARRPGARCAAGRRCRSDNGCAGPAVRVSIIDHRRRTGSGKARSSRYSVSCPRWLRSLARRRCCLPGAGCRVPGCRSGGWCRRCNPRYQRIAGRHGGSGYDSPGLHHSVSQPVSGSRWWRSWLWSG